MAHLSFLVSFLLVSSAFHGIHAVEYIVSNTVPNTEGGARFANELGDDYARQTMISATDFIWQLFQQTSEADRKSVARVTLVIDNYDGIAYASNNEIHMGAPNYLKNIKGDIKEDFNGVLYHEMTHIWQWDGKGKAGKLIEGVADFVRLKANYAPASWPKRGSGTNWDEGYAVTAYFLDYCESLRGGFVAELNKKMRDDYSNDFFVQLLGKTVDQLWSEYKAKYGN